MGIRLGLIILMVTMLSVGFTENPVDPRSSSLSGPTSPCRVTGPSHLDVGVQGKYSASCGNCIRKDDGGVFGCSSEESYLPDYRFDWGDGDISSWGSGTRSHSWSQGGTYYVRAQARCDDGYSDWSSSKPVFIGKPCDITLTSPNGGESWTVGTTHTIKWGYIGDCGSTVKIELLRNGSVCRTITNSTSNDGSYDWTAAQCGSYETGYKIRVSDNSSSEYDDSDSSFDIPDEVIPCNITVTDPSSGDNWNKGTEETIRWNHTGGGSYVKIELYKGPSYQCTISSSTLNDGAYPWIVDDCNGGGGENYRVKITNTSDTDCLDYSDQFKISVPVFMVIQFKAGPILNISGNYPYISDMHISGLRLYFDDPSWSNCSTPGSLVHLRLNPWWEIDSFAAFYTLEGEGMKVAPWTTKVTVTTTADFKNTHPEDRWLAVEYEGGGYHYYNGTTICDDYSDDYNNDGSDWYHFLWLVVSEQDDEVAVSKIHIEFDGWYSSTTSTTIERIVQIISGGDSVKVKSE